MDSAIRCSRRFFVLSLLIAASVALRGGPGHAADGTWTNTASGLYWSTPGNWAGGIVAGGPGRAAEP